MKVLMLSRLDAQLYKHIGRKTALQRLFDYWPMKLEVSGLERQDKAFWGWIARRGNK